MPLSKEIEQLRNDVNNLYHERLVIKHLKGNLYSIIDNLFHSNKTLDINEINEEIDLDNLT